MARRSEDSQALVPVSKKAKGDAGAIVAHGGGSNGAIVAVVRLLPSLESTLIVDLIPHPPCCHCRARAAPPASKPPSCCLTAMR